MIRASSVLCVLVLAFAIVPTSYARQDSGASQSSNPPVEKKSSTEKKSTTTKKAAPAKKPSASTKSSTTAHTTKSDVSGKSARTSKASSRKRSSKKKSTKVRGQQKIDPERAQEIQQALVREHYLSDEQAAGGWNQASEEAMRKFQADHGWQSKTVPDSRALITLGLGPSKEHLLNPGSAMTTVPDPPKSQAVPLTSSPVAPAATPLPATSNPTPAASDPPGPQ